MALTPFLLSPVGQGCGGGGESGGGDTSETAESAETVETPLVGALDAAFGNGGTVVTDIAGLNDRGLGVTVQEDGKIVVCGLTATAADADLLVVRYTSSGALDTTFGSQGSAIAKASSEDESGFGVKIDGTGRIVVAGWAKVDGISKFMLARFLADGALDSTFGTQGIAIPAVGDAEKDAGAYSLAIQSDGKLVAAGVAYVDGVSRIALLRCNEDGTPDSTFGDGKGVASATFGSASAPLSNGGKILAIDASGRIVAGGWVYTGSSQGADFGLVRFDSAGKLDATFNSSGLVNVDLGNNRNDHVYGVAFQEEKLLAIGNTDNGTDKDIGMVRLNEDGSLDSSFGTGGKLTMDYSASTELFGEVIVAKDLGIHIGGTAPFPPRPPISPLPPWTRTGS